MRVLITGATGFIGTTLARHLRACGCQTLPLVRSDRSDDSQPTWSPAHKQVNLGPAGALDAVVHLAGESITGRWTAAKKERIRSSRVEGTRLLSEALAASENPPSVMVTASAVGYYGNRGFEELTEESGPGSDFLAEVAHAWEEATDPAQQAGIRVVHVRIGLVLSPEGGALAKMLPLFKLGLAGRIGHGQQYWSWISLDDLNGLVHFALRQPNVEGPVNGVAPNPVTNEEFTRTLARVLARPALLPMPEKLARMVFGEMAEATLLASTRALPEKLIALGYQFTHPELEPALRHLLGR